MTTADAVLKARQRLRTTVTPVAGNSNDYHDAVEQLIAAVRADQDATRAASVSPITMTAEALEGIRTNLGNLVRYRLQKLQASYGPLAEEHLTALLREVDAQRLAWGVAQAESDRAYQLFSPLLKRICDALKGVPPPEDLVSYDWSDLPAVATRLVDHASRMEAVLVTAEKLAQHVLTLDYKPSVGSTELARAFLAARAATKPGVALRDVVREILAWLRSGDPSRDDFPGGPVGATAHDIADYIEKRWGSP